MKPLLFLFVNLILALSLAQGLPDIPGLPELPFDLPELPIDIPGVDIPEIPEIPDIGGELGDLIPDIAIPDIGNLADLRNRITDLPAHDPVVTSAGLLSYVEDLPEPGNEEGIYRQTPFVEVMLKSGFNECAEIGFDQEECPEFEWSMPFVPDSMHRQSEEEIAKAWFRLETRAYHRTLLEIGAIWQPVACTIGSLDLYWLVFTGQVFVPPSEFCDDVGIQILPKCFFDCDVNLFETTCPVAKGSCAPCIDSGITRAWEHVMTNYYLDYHKDVIANALSPLIAAGGLIWGSNPALTDGALISPVAAPSNAPQVVTEVGETLIPEGVKLDPRAPVYYTQTAALDVACRASLGLGTTFGLMKLPFESFDPVSPGLGALEEVKRELSDRESAGSTWRRTATMLATWDKTAIFPKYSRDGGLVGNIFSGEPSELGAGLPAQAACLGYATFFQAFQNLTDIVPVLHRPITRLSFCWTSYFPPVPGVTVAPLPPRFMIFAGPRWHTDWVSVPEGYDIPRLEGEPYVTLRP